MKKFPITRFSASMPSGPVALAMALTGTLPTVAAPLYWDGISGDWNNLANWSTAAGATTPDPAAFVASDDIIFNIDPVDGAESINFATDQTVNSVRFSNTGTTTVTNLVSATNRILNIGAGGLTLDAGAGAATLGSLTANQKIIPNFTASQNWVNNSATEKLILGSAFTSAAGVNITMQGVGTIGMTDTANSSTISGSLTMQNSARLQLSGDTTINGGLDGTAANTIENGGAASKWMFVANPAATTNNYAGTIQSNPLNPAVRLGFIKRGPGTQILGGSVSVERFAVETGHVVVGSTANVSMNFNAGGANNVVVIGTTANQNGSLTVSGGTLSSTRTGGTALFIGTGANSQGFLKMTSGSISTTGNEIRVGNGAGAYAAYTQDGGSMSSASWIGVGFGNDKAVININGGSLSASTANLITIAAGATTSVATVNVNPGGTLNANAATNGGMMVGERGVGTLNVSGGTVNVATNGLLVGPINSQTGWDGTVNLRSGTINTNRVSRGLGTGAATFNFNGGTLAATGASATFMQGLDNARVYSGGGTINNSGNNITIGQALAAATGDGVSSAGLIVSGSGFLDTPLVNITGGGGTGAKAVATIDALGNLTGIVMTSPGVGYTSAPVFTLHTTLAGVNIGGGIGSTSSITGSATLVANTAGSLTYSGSGITQLTGAGTYGLSTISTGTNLQVDGSLTGGVVTSSGGTLSGIGSIGGNVSVTGGTISPGITGGSAVGTLTVAGSVTLNASSILTLNINDEAPGGFDRIVNTGTFIAGNATLAGSFNDTSFNTGYDAASLATATRYQFVSGPVSGMFGNASLISGADLATLGLPAGSYEVSLSAQRFYVEPGSYSLVPIPEPATTGLLAGLAALGLTRRRRK